MRPEIDRVKHDLETMQKALGLAPAMGRDWIQWMKRDQWFSLWWCVPGLILIVTNLLPLEPTRYGGLLVAQWSGLAVTAAMLLITTLHMRRVSARDGRPEALIRETKRLNGMDAHGWWFGTALGIQAALYLIWCRHFHVTFDAFWTGYFLITGSSCLVAALAARAWPLLGWAIPLLGYGVALLAVGAHEKVNGVLFGLMFIAIALSFSLIATLQIRFLERQK